MVKLDKILDFLCDFAPIELAENYDNVGQKQSADCN